MTQATVIESFRRYFSVETAVTREAREKTFGVRYRVYCEEFSYEQADRFEDRLEIDEFDDRSIHCLITHNSSGMPAGCVRIVPGATGSERSALPFEKFCAESVDRAAIDALQAPETDYCEASRFAVDGAFRRRSGEALTRFGEIASLQIGKPEQRTFPLISVALMLSGTAMAELCGRPAMFAVMEPFLPRLLKRSGMRFERMGFDMNYHGIRALYVTNTEEFVRTIDGEMETFYYWILGQLRDSAAGHPEIYKLAEPGRDGPPSESAACSQLKMA